MSPKAQRIAIARACGWRRKKSAHPDFTWVWMRGEEYTYALPSYLTDLNAMADAESIQEKLNRGFRGRYIEWSETVVGDKERKWPLVRATAAQRAEALLRALSLWKV